MKTMTQCSLLTVLALLLSGCVGMGGEKIALSHKPLAVPTQRYTEKLSVQKPATDLREEKDRIGRATVTMFAITSGSVTTTSPVEEQLSEQIAEAFTSLGYPVTFTNSPNTGASTPALTLKIALNTLWFRNYNWFFPFVPTSGDIKVTLLLENGGGKKLFEKSFEGSGSSFCLMGHCAFAAATKEAMTTILKKITAEFSSPSVRDMITTEYPAGAAAKTTESQ
jgi:hypothetical protein